MPEPFTYHHETVAERIELFTMSGAPSMDQWRGAMKQATDWMLSNESRGEANWCVIIDASGMPGITAPMRRAAGEWRARNLALMANTCLCGAYVAQSAWLRGAVTAIMWFAQPVIPVSIKGNKKDAIAWARARQEEARRRAI